MVIQTSIHDAEQDMVDFVVENTEYEDLYYDSANKRLTLYFRRNKEHKEALEKIHEYRGRQHSTA